MVQVLGGWLVVGLVYLLGYSVLTQLLFRPMASWAVPPAAIAAILIVVPYVAGGLYCRLLQARMARIPGSALLVGVVPALAEKLLGLAIVWRVWAIGAEGIPGQSFWDFLATGVPEIAWFTPVYWAVGLVVSPIVLVLVASPPSCPLRLRLESRS